MAREALCNQLRDSAGTLNKIVEGGHREIRDDERSLPNRTRDSTDATVRVSRSDRRLCDSSW